MKRYIQLIFTVFILFSCNTKTQKQEKNNNHEIIKPYCFGIGSVSNILILKDSFSVNDFEPRFNSFEDSVFNSIKKENDKSIILPKEIVRKVMFDFYFSNRFKDICKDKKPDIYISYLYTFKNIQLYLVASSITVKDCPEINSIYPNSDYYSDNINLISLSNNHKVIDCLNIYSRAYLLGVVSPYSKVISDNRINRIFYINDKLNIELLSYYEELIEESSKYQLINKEKYCMNNKGYFRKVE